MSYLSFHLTFHRKKKNQVTILFGPELKKNYKVTIFAMASRNILRYTASSLRETQFTQTRSDLASTCIITQTLD